MVTCSSRFNIQQDRKIMNNVTVSRVRATILAVEKKYILHTLRTCL
jgi:hypothetical protein